MDLSGYHCPRWQAPLGGEVFALPVLHGKVEFADAVRRVFRELMPTRVALELSPTLAEGYLRAVKRLPLVTALTYEVKRDAPVYLIVEPGDPFCEAARSALESGVPLEFADADLDEPGESFDPVPDTYAVKKLGHRAYMEKWLELADPKPAAADLLREKTMAAHLAATAVEGERVLFVVGAAHLERVGEFLLEGAGEGSGEGTGADPAGRVEQLRRIRPRDVALYHVDPESLAEVLSEPPFVQAVYELTRNERPQEPDLSKFSVRKKVGALELIQGRGGWEVEHALEEALVWAAAKNGAPEETFDRQRAHFHLLMAAARHFEQETGEHFNAWQKRTLFKYLRNWSFIEGQLLPDLYQLVEGARSVADDNYAYAVWRLASHLPWQGDVDRANDLAWATITADMLGLGSRSIRMRRRTRKAKSRPVRLHGKRGKGGVDPSRWLEGFDDEGLCSYPPEDLIVENFGGWLKGKAGRVLSEDAARSEPFRGALLDGIDMRETIRHLPDGEIWVRQLGRVRGGMGSVVIVFDDSPDMERYPYAMTWLGEHEQESDMAFYSTSPADNVVGPGICRCEYGGFMLSYPPLRLYDVWNDPEYDWTRTPAERLLAAAIDYSLEENVVYCAKKAPRGFLKQYAARAAKRVVFVPMGTISPRTLAKARVMHILDGKEKRELAPDYIW